MPINTEIEETEHIGAGRLHSIQSEYDGKDETEKLKFPVSFSQIYGVSERPILTQSISFNYETHSSQFGTTTSKQKKALSDVPELERIDIHNPALTSRVKSLMRVFWAIVVSKACQTAFPIDKTVVDVFKDQIENRTQTVLRVFTDSNASQAIAFWQGLESDIEDWLLELNNQDRQAFLRSISLRIHWNERYNK